MSRLDDPRCFDCNEKLDGFTATDDDAPIPEAGAVSVCLYCGAVAIFTGNGLERREPTDDERSALDVHPQIVDVRQKAALVREGLRTGVVVVDSTTLPCGCVLTQAVVAGDKQLLIEACSETCQYLAYAVTEERKAGKPTTEIVGTLTTYLDEQRQGRAC